MTMYRPPTEDEAPLLQHPEHCIAVAPPEGFAFTDTWRVNGQPTEALMAKRACDA